MKNFIEELFYGNIDPQARGYTMDSNIKKVSDKINDIEEQLTNKLNNEEKALFLDLICKYHPHIALGFEESTKVAWTNKCNRTFYRRIYKSAQNEPRN